MKMAKLFGASICTPRTTKSVLPHIVIPHQSVLLEERDDLLSALPIQKGHLILADHQLGFLIALLSPYQQKAIRANPKIKHVGEVNLDINTLTSLVKNGMRILSNPNIKKDAS